MPGIRTCELNIVNKVRLFMHITTVSEIAKSRGTHISKEWGGKERKYSAAKINDMK